MARWWQPIEDVTIAIRAVRPLLAGAVALLVLAGCGGEPPLEEPGAPSPTETEGVAIEARTQQAIDVLAEELGIEDPATIEVVVAEPVTWPSGALGCPQPGEAYTQALVEGFRIVLRYDGERYAFHGGGGTGPFLCEDPEDPVAGS